MHRHGPSKCRQGLPILPAASPPRGTGRGLPPRTTPPHLESRGQTAVNGHPGTTIVRIVQNDQGHSLPPDLMAAARKHSPRAGPGELITLIDMDHNVEGTFDPDSEWVVARVYELHDHIVETFHDHVVARDAIEEWN